MSTTHQPRFSVAEIKRREDSHVVSPRVNVGTVERWASGVGGVVLIAQGLKQRSLPGAALACLGGGLLWRGLSGHCGAYRALKINTAGKQADPATHQGRLIKHSLIVARPAQELYDFWSEVENAPKFMSNIAQVARTGPGRSHWVSTGPFGKTFEWDSEVINDEPGHLIAWQSLPGSDVSQAGVVRFEPMMGGRETKVTVEVNYEPPAGAIGVALAKLIGQDPDAMTRENLEHFKQLMETGAIASPAGGAAGRV